MTTIWHNPRCSKSRQTLALIEDRNPVIRRYLDDGPSADEITQVLRALDLPAKDIIRKGDPLFKDLSLAGADEAQLIAAMAAHPILIERPIVIKGDKACLGRPPQDVLTLFTDEN